MNELEKMRDQLSEAVYQRVNAMEPVHQAAFLAEWNQKRKSTVVAYVFWILGSVLGLHYLYFRKPLLFFLYLFTLGGLGLWWIVDCFRIPGLVRKQNQSTALDALRNVQVLQG